MEKFYVVFFVKHKLETQEVESSTSSGKSLELKYARISSLRSKVLQITGLSSMVSQ
jgi:hypothetical protein